MPGQVAAEGGIQASPARHPPPRGTLPLGSWEQVVDSCQLGVSTQILESSRYLENHGVGLDPRPTAP